MFIEEIDINNPDLVIDLGRLNAASQMYSIMRKRKIIHYAYAFYWRPNLLKEATLVQIGESAPANVSVEKGVLGERIVRKAANLSGWKVPAISSTGIELQRALEAAVNEGVMPYVPDRTEMLVAVWDLTNRTAKMRSTNREQSMWAEGELTKQYKMQNDGLLPVGNIKDCERNTSYYKKTYIPTDVWGDLFQEI
jgi:hypothetical protein